ncbi:TraU family protein [Pseudoalteromonas luteoviolacea]|uniref:TraU family protein n=1 Tax=Pseudoalteromonas luteoviolacea TaxID=43657 RepID=UPI001B398339|nr:TraU family protein [Pseudoalteromonas luteoviolacea]MBQ4839845.1 TraU family protein [Pseudoalteromonas luteoviolacea]
MRHIVIFIVLMLGLSSQVQAGSCNGRPLNPILDVSWQNMFPISIGGVVEVGNWSGGGFDDAPTDPICVCNNGTIPKVGLSVSFWEPARLIDTVSTPYCMMPLGVEMNAGGLQGQLGGSFTSRNGHGKLFQQMHYFIFPVLAILDMYTDLPCIDYDRQFDLAMITEILPTWNDDLLAMVVNPEAVLFANPAAALACAADASSTIFGRPINALYWCMGGWGSTYPLAGSITATDYAEGNAGLAARGIYLMARTGLLEEFSPNGCSRYYAPIWNKDRYRLQMTRPVVDSKAKYIGTPGLLWTQNKHPLVGKDNFSWLMFRKVNCCVSAY